MHRPFLFVVVLPLILAGCDTLERTLLPVQDAGLVPEHLHYEPEAGDADATRTVSLDNPDVDAVSVVVAEAPAWAEVVVSNATVPGRATSPVLEVSVHCGPGGGYEVGTVVLDLGERQGSAELGVSRTCPHPVGGSDDGFDVDVRFMSGAEGMTTTQHEAFQESIATWASAIAGDLVDVEPLDPEIPLLPEGACDLEEDFNRPVDDLVLFVRIHELEDAVGRGGPCSLRYGGASDGLPWAGTVAIDADFMARSAGSTVLTGTITHEIGHVLGIGTLWEWGDRDLLPPEGEGCEDRAAGAEVRYVGPQGTFHHQQLGGVGHPIVETERDEGANCSHWSRAAYGPEVMTSGAREGRAVSTMSLGTLEDFGYAIRASAYEASASLYTLPTATALRALDAEPEFLIGENEILVLPDHVVRQ